MTTATTIAPSILFTGGEEAGKRCLLMLAEHYLIKGLVPSDDGEIRKVAAIYNIPEYKTVEEAPALDVLLSVHSRKILPEETLKRFKLGCWNIHPFLLDFPGADPVGKFLRLHQSSQRPLPVHVGVHRMTGSVDVGPMLHCVSGETTGTTYQNVYEDLYPLYLESVVEWLGYINDKMQKM